MKIREIIDFLNENADWINLDETRDILLCGDEESEITRIGVCWVATNRAIAQGIEKGVQLIISHENPFYHATTSPKRLARLSAEKKRQLLAEHGIALYRCHDVWDKMPGAGIADSWGRRLGFAFSRKVNSYNQYAAIPKQTVGELARHVAECLRQDGENGVYVFGDVNKSVSHLGIGTGAATDIFQMLSEYPCDVCIVADDGISNFYEGQYALDNGLSLIVVNHSCCEIAGMQNMASYLRERFSEPEVFCLEEGYTVTHVVASAEGVEN